MRIGTESLRVTCVCGVMILILAAGAAAEGEGDLELADLIALEATWEQKRHDLDVYHIIQRSRRSRGGDDAPWRYDTYVRMGNALHHSFYTENRPNRITESVTVAEPDGRMFLNNDSGIREQGKLSAAVTGVGLGRVFTDGAEGVRLLARPPASDTWQFILYRNGETDHYIVHDATGAVFQREARDADGRTTYLAIREPQPLHPPTADAGIRRMMARASAAEASRAATVEQEVSGTRRAVWLTCGFVLLCLGAGSRRLFRNVPRRLRHLWLGVTGAVAGLVAVSYFALEHGIFPFYSMLLTAIADVPVALLRLPQTIGVHSVLLILIHSLIFGTLWLTAAWLAARWMRSRTA